MARMTAKCFFAALMIALTTAPSLADQHLEAVSIGGFTWNLNETDLKSAGRADFAQRPFYLRQTPHCQFAQVSLIRKDLGTPVVAGWMFNRFPFSNPECFLNGICPQERCYVLENENTWIAKSAPMPRSANRIFDRLTNSGIPGMASDVVQVTSNKMSLLLTSFAKGIFQTASYTAQHARFPIESLPIHSVKFVNRRVHGFNRTKDADANPLRIAERLQPALLPFESAENVNISVIEAPIPNLKTCAVVESKRARIKTRERMDAYWNYYADCDRWKVVLAENAKTQTSNSISTPQFGWVEHIVATAANLDIWLSCAIRQLESQSRSIGRDCQATWKDIEFHLFQASFAASKGTFQKVHYSTKTRYPE